MEIEKGVIMKKIFWTTTIFLFFISFFCGLSQGARFSSFAEKARVMKAEQIGSVAPDFTLKTLHGYDVNFTEFRSGRRAIIFFGVTSCKPCQMDRKRLFEKYKDDILKKDILLVLINIGQKEDVVREYANAEGIEYNILIDEQFSLREPYAVFGFPTFIFIDEEGIVRTNQNRFPDDYEALFLGPEEIGK